MSEGLRLAAAHHREHAVLGAGLAAGDRRIDEVKAVRLGLGVQFARDLRRCGGVIDNHRVLAHAGEHTVVAEHDLAQVVVVADAGHHEILALGGLLWRRRAPAAELRYPFFGLGGGAVVDGDVVAALGLQMSGHRVTHDPQADKSYLRHRSSPFLAARMS
jgi:hypothetical protein